MEGHGSGYSLWLMPQGELKARLQERISVLAAEYDGPVFEPHVTLAGGIAGTEADALIVTKRLVGMMKPFELNLDRPAHEDVYFRNLYIRIRQDEPVMQAGSTAGVTGYMPHLSLFYGRLPEKTRKLLCNDPDTMMHDSFTVGSVHLYRTHGPCREWQGIGEYPFKG